MGKSGQTLGGDFDPDKEYPYLETVMYDHDSWTSKKRGNKGHTPAEGSEWWQRSTNGGKHAYDEGETAKQKGNAAKQKGDDAEVKGNNADFYARFAKLVAENPPKIGKDIAGHSEDDLYWWFFVPNAGLDGGTWVNSNVWSKGDDLDYESLSEAQKQEFAAKILELVSVVSQEDAEAVWGDYVFETTD